MLSAMLFEEISEDALLKRHVVEAGLDRRDRYATRSAPYDALRALKETKHIFVPRRCFGQASPKNVSPPGSSAQRGGFCACRCLQRGTSAGKTTQ